MFRIQKLAVTFSLFVLCPLGLWAEGFGEKFQWERVEEIYPGIKIAEQALETPRKVVMYCAQIDLENPRIRFKTTGRCENWVQNKTETLRKSTRKFLEKCRAEKMDMVLAINADAFSPWPAPWDKEDETNLIGLAVADGVMVSPASKNPSFVKYTNGEYGILYMADESLDGVELAVSGFSFVLEKGEVTADGEDLHPRTGLGLSEDKNWLYLLVVDGRRHASQGANVREVGEYLAHFGAYDGLNMDGGGSSTMARWDSEQGVVLINRPVGSGVNWLELPKVIEDTTFGPTERNNGNNLGVWLSPE